MDFNNQLWFGHLYFISQFRPTIQYSDQIFKVMTRHIVPITPSIKSFQLGTYEVGSGDYPDLLAGWQPDRFRMLSGQAISSVAKTKDVALRRHHIQHDSLGNPTANRGAFAGIFSKTAFTQFLRKLMIGG